MTALVDGRDRIVVTGSASDPSSFGNNVFAIRLNGDGKADGGFGASSGRALTGSIISASRASFTHDGGLLVFGNDPDTDGSFGTAYKMIGYDLPPVLPPSGF